MSSRNKKKKIMSNDCLQMILLPNPENFLSSLLQKADQNPGPCHYRQFPKMTVFFIIERRCIPFSIVDLDREGLATEDENEGAGFERSGR